MIKKIGITFYETLIFLICFLAVLIFFSDFRPEIHKRILVKFPQMPIIKFSSSDLNFDIFTGSRVMAPMFFSTPKMNELDSRLTKQVYSCDNTRVYNWVMTEVHMTFTIDSRKDEFIDACYEKLKKQMNEKWEKEKEEAIYFLSDTKHSLSEISHIMINDVERIHDFKKIKEVGNVDCENFAGTIVHKKYYSVLKMLLDACGNEHILSYNPQIDKTNVYRKINKNCKDNCLCFPENDNQRKQFIENQKLTQKEYVSIVQKSGLNSLFYKKNDDNETNVMINLYDKGIDKLNINPDIVDLKKYLELNHCIHITISPEKQITMQEPIMSLQDLNIILDSVRAGYASSIKRLYNTTISEIRDNTLKEHSADTTYSLEEFRNAKLVWLHTPNIDLAHLRTFSKFGLYLTALIVSIFAIVIKRLLFNFFYKENKSL